MPDFTVKLPEPEEGKQWVVDGNPRAVRYGKDITIVAEWKAVPKPTEWVNVRMRRELAERMGMSIYEGQPSLRFSERDAIAAACREALAEKPESCVECSGCHCGQSACLAPCKASHASTEEECGECHHPIPKDNATVCNHPCELPRGHA